MSLDFTLTATRVVSVFDTNMTHNVGKMADEAGIYDCLWRPLHHGFTRAEHLIESLQKGLALLESDPTRFRKFSAPNGWGTYEQFVPWVREVLKACQDNPDAAVNVSI